MPDEAVRKRRLRHRSARPRRHLRPRARHPATHRYLDRIHRPTMIVLALLTVSIGAIGYGLRPGTDSPPVVPNSSMQIYVDGAISVSVDETLYQLDSKTVALELDVFGILGPTGKAQWSVLTDRTAGQPHPCPDRYRYVGRAHPTPFVISDGGLTLGEQPISETALTAFTGTPEDRTAANVLGMAGASPGRAATGKWWPIAKVSLCWDSGAPLAFNGQYVSATLPAVRVDSRIEGAPRFEVTRSLYFVDPARQDNPVTAQYSLQAGTLPTTTDPFGWHWAADDGDAVQLTGISLPIQQRGVYIGFVSGVLLGIAGGALVSLIQAAVLPLRWSRREQE
ncbi:hypothetical protein HH310_33915 [Actinoplanes sp. TBRC 11911]|uniref:hypothetical protein n=1 Tax=Actinoplanes sp. TBRC 11911 TaxID=2729386 RepID=UPI00145ECA71|nr:hypothetical protein [Actinoplanes sp. TBRC 11911]NMO56162.1 hypothetical protein [Actinoplanes sp. TBRC 11911]